MKYQSMLKQQLELAQMQINDSEKSYIYAMLNVADQVNDDEQQAIETYVSALRLKISINTELLAANGIMPWGEL